jgi:trimeric autotransporter adhesin
MRNFTTRSFIFLFFFVSLNSIRSYSQRVNGQPTDVRHDRHTVFSKNGMNAGPKNYTSFSAPYFNKSEEALRSNPGYEQHPELGQLFAETPCDNCYELVGKRTEISKTFIKEGTDGRDIMQQTSSAPMHYKGTDGQWRTIKTKLEPQRSNGLFAANDQPTPVRIDLNKGKVQLLGAAAAITFNNNLELVFEKPDGTEQLLGAADYSHYTAGDDGAYVIDAWPGIDIEMYVLRGAVKTNFWIKHAMPAYADGKLLVRDHMDMDAGLSLYSGSQSKFTGNLELRNANGSKVYDISAATAFEKRDPKTTLQFLEYRVGNAGRPESNVLDIALPGDFLNRADSAYPVIIDPLVTISTPSGVNGTTYSAGWTVGCVYNNPATVPAQVTVTDVQFTFQYVSSGGAMINNGAYDFKLGVCRSPTPTFLYWNCNPLIPTSGTCDAVGASIFPQITTCMPGPQCTSYDLNLTMDFYQNYLSDPACSPLYITAGTPLTIAVFGHTVEATAIVATPTTICQGQSSTLTASGVNGVAPYTYSWMPGAMTGATVVVSPTTTTIYTVTVTDACGGTNTATKTINVNPISPITGVTTVCVGGTSPLADAVTGGTWVSTNTAVATIGSSSGIVSGLTIGTTTIKYTTGAGCIATITVTVIPAVAAITGATAVCQGSTITLSDATPGGTWTSSNPAIVGVGSLTGVALGVSGGVATISYSPSGGGCYALTTITVNPLSPITGTTSLCVGGTTTLSDLAPGGTWSSGNPAIATINPSTGVVNGISLGSAGITYVTPAGCTATTTVNVGLLSAIGGILTVCQGKNTTLTHAISGGTWTSGNPAVATINPATGVVTGVVAGTAPITYTVPGGCAAYITVTVNPLGPISGSLAVCVGGISVLSDPAGPGNWNSTNPAVATIGATTGIVTGISLGTANITYTSPAGCIASATVTVSLLTPITGPSVVCQGASITLSNVTPGGTWSSGTPATATVDPVTGVVIGVSGGVVNISYAIPSGCAVAYPVTVNPVAPIGGTLAICVGSTATLTNSIPGGSWSSSMPTVATIDPVTGLVTGISIGTADITYITGSGCTTTATLTVSVPAPITGITTICQGSISPLSNAVPGGVWTSSAPGIAAIDPVTGVVAGISGGIATITYATSGGCNATATVTINPLAGITGEPTVCVGSTITLTDATPGGTWSSLSPAIATIGPSSGIVTGVSGGTAVINYTTPAGCVASVTVTVFPLSPISGTPTVCQGSATVLSDATPGGTWSSSDPSVAPVVPTTGLVSGTAAGTATISYTTPAGCVATIVVTVNPITPITGTASACAGSTSTLSDATPGGTWSSVTTAVATVDPATGVVTGVTPGTSVIKYTTGAGCIASVTFTVNAQPSAIGGTTVICQGSATVLTNTLPGGTWSSSDPSVASIVPTTGLLSGASAGTATITYTSSAGCFVTVGVTVNPLAPITGTPSVCVAGTTTLSDATPGGTWSSMSPGVATVNPATGLVTGVAAGTATIKYTTSLGCVASKTVTVNPLPSAIIGALSVCKASTTTLSNTLPGGIWTSSNPLVATIGSLTGVVTGVNVDTVTVTYTSAAGCSVSGVLTVNPLPASITGIAVVCVGGTTTFSDITPGGTWSSFSPAIASINPATGVATGVSAGITNIKYTTPAGCFVITPVTVNPLPAAITGTTVLCEGTTSTLSNTLTGGSWSSTDPAIASIGAISGMLNGIAAGTCTISYITPAGCYAVTNVTVNPTPVITGFSFTNPTTCVDNNGTITLFGLTSGETYTVNYNFGVTPVVAVITADGAGNVVITGLAAGSYSNITVTSSLGCMSNKISGPIVLTLPAAPPAPVANNNTPICAGNAVNLTATDAMPGVTYSWTGPAGFTSTLQNPTIPAAPVSVSGTYTVTATIVSCVSAAATTVVVVHPIPAISGFSSQDPSTCLGSDGQIALFGLIPGVTYTINYTFNGAPAVATVIANVSGTVIISGLSAGTYAGFIASSFTCISNSVGPITLKDPRPAPTPEIGSNSPICVGKTLKLTATDIISDLTYEWVGPNGFTSNDKNPQIPGVTMADSGIYTLTIRYKNCPTTTSKNIMVHPTVVLQNITPDQVVPYGGSIQLSATGAQFYQWSPSNGTLDNPNIDSPIATPQESIRYSVEGMNVWGCLDTASVYITVDFEVNEFIPTAFTPNGDGLNDIFRIGNVKYDKLVDFSIFNRWGQCVYHNSYQSTQGWDGTFHGVQQEIGTYFYNIILTTPGGKTKYFKGEVTLIR